MNKTKQNGTFLATYYLIHTNYIRNVRAPLEYLYDLGGSHGDPIAVGKIVIQFKMS